MPAIQCPDGKWKWGEGGQCVHDSKAAAEAAGRAIQAQEHGELSPALMFADLSAHEVKIGEDGLLWILGVPKAKYPKHPQYGDLDFNAERLTQYHENLQRRVYHIDPPIDYEHAPTTEGAAGWVKASELRDNGLWLGLEMSDSGQAAIEGKRFRYFSPTLYDQWRDPATGNRIANVLAGGALTINPYLKDAMGAHPIVFGEGVVMAFRDGSLTADPHRRDADPHRRDAGATEETEMTPEEIKALNDAKAAAEKKAQELEAKVEELEAKAGGDDEAVRKQLAEETKAREELAKRLADSEQREKERELADRLGKVNVELRPGDLRALTPEGRKFLSAVALQASDETPKVLNEQGVEVDGVTPREHFMKFIEELPKYLYPVGQMGFTAEHRDPANADPQAEMVKLANEKQTAAGVNEDGSYKLSYEAAQRLVEEEHPELVERYEQQQKQLKG